MVRQKKKKKKRREKKKQAFHTILWWHNVNNRVDETSNALALFDFQCFATQQQENLNQNKREDLGQDFIETRTLRYN